MLTNWNEISPHFAPEEIFSEESLSAFRRNIILVNFSALHFLNDFRRYIGYPLLVNFDNHTNRGVRTYIENAKVGGGEFSYHMQGIAFDITCLTLSVEELKEAAIKFGWSGIGFYPERNFIHCDLRPLLTKGPIQW